MRVTPHLHLDEVACRDSAPYPQAWIRSRLLPLAIEFEAIRAMCGDKPIRVLSAYRTPAHNARVGGSRYSQHLQGRALDLAPPNGMTVEEFANVVNARALHIDSFIHGIGVYPRFIHIDTRDADDIVRWFGTRPRAEGPRKRENE